MAFIAGDDNRKQQESTQRHSGEMAGRSVGLHSCRRVGRRDGKAMLTPMRRLACLRLGNHGYH
jgi:hypothetical protein